MLRRPRFLFWPACCAILIALFLFHLSRFHHPVYGFTSLLQFDASNEHTMVAAARDRPVFLNRVAGGYDGLYYAQLACSPLLLDPALPTAIDSLSYRARRILPSWTAWLVGFGNPSRALDVYALINPVCWLVLAALLFVLFPPRSAHDFVAWGGLLLSAGALSSVRFALIDLPALLLLAGVMLAVMRDRLRGATGLLAAAALTRETSLIASPVLWRGPWRGSLVRTVLAVAPLALWLVYIRWVTGVGNAGWSNFDWPGAKYIEKWQASFASFDQPELVLLSWANLLALVALTVQAAWLIAWPQVKNLWWRFGIGYAGLLLFLGTAVWEGYPGAATRVLLPLNLAFNMLAPRTRVGLAILILGNLTVPAGILQFANLPNDSVELAAVRDADRTVLVQTRSGWSGVERDAQDFWSWSSGTATLAIVIRPAGASLAMDFRLRSLAPRTVEISQGGRSLWRGAVGKNWVLVSLRCSGGSLDFSTDAPAVPESDAHAARGLAFCIDRVRLSEIQSTPAKSTAPPNR